VLDACRLGMGLADVEKSANLTVTVGDPLAEGVAAPEGGFAGIMVDMFIDGKLLPQLMNPDAWRVVRSKLRDPVRGRVMAHLGPAAAADGALVPQTVLALNAMAQAFGEVHYIDPPEGSQLDVVAMTGQLPDKTAWAQSVGPLLAPYTVDWERWEFVEVEVEGMEDEEAGSGPDQDQGNAEGQVGTSGGGEGGGDGAGREWGQAWQQQASEGAGQPAAGRRR